MATIIYSKEIDIDIDTDDIIDRITTEELVEELHIRRKRDQKARDAITNMLLEYYSQRLNDIKYKFDSSPTDALNVLQDLLGMQHTTSKEQVLEQLKAIL